MRAAETEVAAKATGMEVVVVAVTTLPTAMTSFHVSIPGAAAAAVAAKRRLRPLSRRQTQV